MDPYAYDTPTSDTRRMAVIGHLGGLAPIIGVPGFVIPLVVWLMERDKDAYVERHAREALNFQISVGIYSIALIVLISVLWVFAIGLLFIPVLAVLWIARLILSIVGAVRANDGGFYRYPLTLRFV